MSTVVPRDLTEPSRIPWGPGCDSKWYGGDLPCRSHCRRRVRGRCVRHVEAGHSCRVAAHNYDVSPLVINLVAVWRETGSVEPRPRGGYRHSKLNEHRAFILSQVERQSDITMPKLAAVLAEAKGVDVDPSTLLHSHRLRLQL